MAKFGSFFAWLTYLFIVIASIVYFIGKSHFHNIYTFTQRRPVRELIPHLDDIYELTDENVETKKLDDDLVVMIKSFTAIFGQICQLWQSDLLKNSENCLKMEPCDLYLKSAKLEHLIDEDKSKTLNEIQEFFDTHFEARTTFIFCSVSLSRYENALYAPKNERIPFSKLYQKHKLIIDNSRSKTPTSGVLEELYKSFISNAFNYMDCQDDLNGILRETRYSPETIKDILEVRELKNTLQELVMKTVLKLSARNQEMQYYTTTYPVILLVGLINVLLMLVFYFCPMIPFCLAFGIQLLYRIVCCKTFGKPKVEHLWALKCLKDYAIIKAGSITSKKIVRLLKSKAKKNRRKSKK